jgi:hypothetical protein
VFDFTYDGPGVAKRDSGVLRAGGQVVATQKIPHTIGFLMVRDGTFEVGIDTRTPMDDRDYQVPLAVNGRINKLTYDLGRSELCASKVEQMKLAAIRAG